MYTNALFQAVNQAESNTVLDPVFIKSSAQPKDFPPDRGMEVAVVGRSNSGKSSAVNALAGVRKLARTSKTPGRTQLINFFGVAEERRIVDLPGYGFARVPPAVRAKWREFIEAYFAQRESLVGLIVTMDIRRELSELDRTMLNFASDLSLETLVLLTKADKLSRGAGLSAQARVRKELAGFGEVMVFSGLKGQGVDAARRHLTDWLQITEPAARRQGAE